MCFLCVKLCHALAGKRLFSVISRVCRALIQEHAPGCGLIPVRVCFFATSSGRHTGGERTSDDVLSFLTFLVSVKTVVLFMKFARKGGYQ